MKRRRRVWPFVLAVVVLVALNGWQSRRLAAWRQSSSGTKGVEAKAAPPLLNFVMAGLGGFRGVVAEILWFRVHRLQEENRFMELIQLSEWITMLDPHATEAWVYHAWNLAYNISIMMERPEDRLRWVHSGIALLRDEGLRFNPQEARLYRELAWFYQNKLGDDLDEAHLTYKFDLLTRISPLLEADGRLKRLTEDAAALEELGLERAFMIELEERYGALDWRIPATHAVYWAARGLPYASGSEGLLAWRALYQPLIQLFFNGRFTGDPSKRIWETAANLALAIPVADLLDEVCQLFGNRILLEIRERYLRSAIHLLHSQQCDAQAQLLHKRLGALSPAAGRLSYAELLKEIDEEMRHAQP